MVTKLSYYISRTMSPYVNLAVEEWLLDHVSDGECILYLWQNQRTVVIGRNQIASHECNIEQLKQDGGHLVRRQSGGGAVYHDTGNLNFSFLVCKKDYSVNRQLSVIEAALQSFGLTTIRDGRNDLMIGRKKYSGNAYYLADSKCCHHGTLMVAVDIKRMSEYLTVNAQKLKAKGVPSVQARVGNLSELNPKITVSSLSKSILEKSQDVYEMQAENIELIDDPRLEKLIEKYQSHNWNFGRNPNFTDCITVELEKRSITLRMEIVQGRIHAMVIETDLLEPMDTDAVCHRWIGEWYNKEEILTWIKEAGWKESIMISQ